MLLTHDKFSQFTRGRSRTRKPGSQVLLCLSRDSRESVDSTVERGVAAGGTADPRPNRTMG